MVTHYSRNIGLFIFGVLFRTLALGMHTVAVPLYILDRTGSAALMGYFGVIGVLPSVLLTPFGGVLGDRLNRKWLMAGVHISAGLLMLLLMFLENAGRLTIPLLFLIQALISATHGISRVAAMALFPELVPDRELPRANSLLMGTSCLAMLVGPILGGYLYTLSGMAFVFLLIGSCIILQGTNEAFIVYISKSRKKSRLSVFSILDEIRRGMSYIRSKKGLRQLVGLDVFMWFWMQPMTMVAIPFIVKQVFQLSNIQFGILTGIHVAGGMAGSVYSGLLKKWNALLTKAGIILQAGIMFLTVFVLLPPVLEILGQGSWRLFSLLASLFFLIGFFGMVALIPITTNIQRMISNEIRSRVFSMMYVLENLAVPVGMLVFGIALDKMAPYLFMICVGTAVFSGTAGFVLLAKKEIFEDQGEEAFLRRLDRAIETLPEEEDAFDIALENRRRALLDRSKRGSLFARWIRGLG